MNFTTIVWIIIWAIGGMIFYNIIYPQWFKRSDIDTKNAWRRPRPEIEFVNDPDYGGRWTVLSREMMSSGLYNYSLDNGYDKIKVIIRSGQLIPANAHQVVCGSDPPLWRYFGSVTSINREGVYDGREHLTTSGDLEKERTDDELTKEREARILSQRGSRRLSEDAITDVARILEAQKTRGRQFGGDQETSK